MKTIWSDSKILSKWKLCKIKDHQEDYKEIVKPKNKNAKITAMLLLISVDVLVLKMSVKQ
jgi:hypothetical protein